VTTIKDIAEAFSGHRFAEAVPHLAADARWVLVGQATIEGRDAIVAACENTAAELAATTITFTRFLSAADAGVVAVDAVGRYVDEAGRTSVVSSCDIYEFDRDTLVAITSYAVELPEG
jgi:limonene-1,2-epoxide hydrolase